MSNSVIEVKDVSLAYSIYNKPSDMLKEVLFGNVRHDSFWALRDVNLTVKEGERVGIIGPNGAGKSTLLQIIAGKLHPTKGQVTVNGGISSLLSMVPAWNADETGLDNIRHNLMMKGVEQSKIPHLVDDIIDFAEIGQFIYHPVKTYSTGMGARLSFAIATATEPEILIVDEVLGTGDGYFAWKAMKRMQDFCDRGRALLFVSHSTSSVQQMCDRVVWIQNGTVRLEGEAGYVLKQYELDFRKAEDEQLRASHAVASSAQRALPHLDQMTEDSFFHLRIVASNGGTFSDTHFIKSIQYEWENGEKGEIPLDWVDQNESDFSGGIDTLNCEWGRLHEHSGVLCRILTRSTGRHPGGQFLVRVPEELKNTKNDAKIKISYTSSAKSENLVIEYLDLQNGSWMLAETLKKPSQKGEWISQEFKAPRLPVLDEHREKIVKEIAEKTQAEAEIISVQTITSEGLVAAFTENETFEIQVKVMFHKPVELADVGIKLTRADGVYTFWQSSGQVEANLENAIGERTFRFIFKENLLGAGEYLVNAHVTNGWNFPENYPYTRVYARGIDVLRFKILPENNELDFGILNIRVPVEID